MSSIQHAHLACQLPPDDLHRWSCSKGRTRSAGSGSRQRRSGGGGKFRKPWAAVAWKPEDPDVAVVNAGRGGGEAETEVAEVEDNMNMGDHRSRNQFHRNMDGGGAFCPCKKKVVRQQRLCAGCRSRVVAIMGTITMMFTGQTRLSIKINHNSLNPNVQACWRK